MKRIIFAIGLIFTLAVASIAIADVTTGDGVPHRTMIPQTDVTYDLGTNASGWRRGYIQNIANSTFNYGTGVLQGGGSNTYAVTLAYAKDNATNMLVSGTILVFSADANNGATATYISVNGGTPREILWKNDASLAADHIEADQMVVVVYGAGRNVWHIVQTDANP